MDCAEKKLLHSLSRVAGLTVLFCLRLVGALVIAELSTSDYTVTTIVGAVLGRTVLRCRQRVLPTRRRISQRLIPSSGLARFGNSS